MKCRICARPTAGTGKLCVDCTKALKRARSRSSALRNSPPLPDQVGADGARTSWSLGPISVSASSWRGHIAWATAGLVAIGAIYLGQPEVERRPESDVVVIDRGQTYRSETSKVDGSPSMPSEAPSVSVASIPAPVAAKAGARSSAQSTNAKRDSISSLPSSTLANDTAASNAKAGPPSEAEESQLLARANVSPTSPLADAGQSFSSAMEKCGAERLLSRFMCEQKMYLQYCEDKWDKDPRCSRKSGSN